MKYVVMECHEAYAVLMDEDSAFVKAANLHYEVGQTVTQPILMNDETAEKRRSKVFITRFAAAAACLMLLAGGGYYHYSKNYKVYSTVVISSDANIRMYLNEKGKVIRIKSDNQLGNELLKDYDGKGKDKLTAANEIIELGISKGIISDGDTVDVYVSGKDPGSVKEFKESLKKSSAGLDLNVNVVDESETPAAVTVIEPTKPAEPIEPPKPDATAAAPADPIKPPAEPAAPEHETAKPDAPVPEVKTPETPAAPPHDDNKAVPPAVPDAPAHPDAPDPQQPDIRPDDKNDPPKPPEITPPALDDKQKPSDQPTPPEPPSPHKENKNITDTLQTPPHNVPTPPKP